MECFTVTCLKVIAAIIRCKLALGRLAAAEIETMRSEGYLCRWRTTGVIEVSIRPARERIRTVREASVGTFIWTRTESSTKYRPFEAGNVKWHFYIASIGKLQAELARGPLYLIAISWFRMRNSITAEFMQVIMELIAANVVIWIEYLRSQRLACKLLRIVR